METQGKDPIKCQVQLHASGEKNVIGHSYRRRRLSINSLVSWGDVQFPCLNQSYYNPK